MNLSAYLARYNRPAGILLISWTVIYLVIRWYSVRVVGAEPGMGAVYGAGLVLALTITFVATHPENLGAG